MENANNSEKIFDSAATSPEAAAFDSAQSAARAFTRSVGSAQKMDAYGFLDYLAAHPDVPRKHGRVLLVTADTPLLASRGEGKTTATMALVDALRARGVDAVVALRQPSMGITAAGSKGGASGGGRSSLADPILADWGLFGEMMRIAAAQNLIVSRAEKALEEGELDTVLLPRVSEIPSKALRAIAVARGQSGEGSEVPEKCVLTPTCEMMQILTLGRSRAAIEAAVGKMIVGTKAGQAVLARDVVDSRRVMTVLGDALDPAILTTLHGSPVYVHCGPFANVSLGIPSIVSIEAACALHDVVIVEAGYGADAGAQKYLDIAVREAGAPMPVAAVVVARATTWLDNPKLSWRYSFNIGRLERTGIPCFPLCNLWDGEDDEVPALRERMKQSGFRAPMVGNLFRDGGEPLIDQMDALAALLAGQDADLAARAGKALTSLRGVPLMKKLTALIEESYGVPAERVITRDTFEPAVAAARVTLESAGMSLDDLAVNAVKSPATITDNDELPARERTVTLKKVEAHAGAGILHVNLTTSLTTPMPKIV